MSFLFIRVVTIISFSLGLSAAVSAFASADSSALELYHTPSKKFITLAELDQLVPANGTVVLGEFHHTPNIQSAQAQVVEALVQSHQAEGSFDLGWEFLNFSDQSQVKKSFEDFSDGRLNADQFLKALFPNARDPLAYRDYLPVLKATSKYGGRLLALNAPRKIKTQLREKGFVSLPAEFQPPRFKLGGRDYLERFTAIMGGHVPPEKLESYYLAQCYTDDVMAWQLGVGSIHKLRFVVAGSFHTDFFDGMVERLDDYVTGPVTTFKFVDLSQIPTPNRDELLKGSGQYGDYADLIVFSSVRSARD